MTLNPENLVFMSILRNLIVEKIQSTTFLIKELKRTGQMDVNFDYIVYAKQTNKVLENSFIDS